MEKKILVEVMTEEGVTMESLLKSTSQYNVELHEIYKKPRSNEAINRIMGKPVLCYSVYLPEDMYKSARQAAKKGELEGINYKRTTDRPTLIID